MGYELNRGTNVKLFCCRFIRSSAVPRLLFRHRLDHVDAPQHTAGAGPVQRQPPVSVVAMRGGDLIRMRRESDWQARNSHGAPFAARQHARVVPTGMVIERSPCWLRSLDRNAPGHGAGHPVRRYPGARQFGDADR
ncbi:MAG: hypothetical protein R3E47_10120 [Paracoccaceae bacterium]